MSSTIPEIVCSNACNKEKCRCFLIDKYYGCNHYQCVNTASRMDYCIQCGNNEKNKEVYKLNNIRYYMLLELKEKLYSRKYKVSNETCPVCLDDQWETYENHFDCSHAMCHECYYNLNNKICPLCRSN